MEPIKLKIKNFYSIAEGEIDFTKFSSALILGNYADNPLKSNGAGKCLEASTFVYDPDKKERITIERFVKEKRKKVLGLSPDNRLVPVDVIDWHNTGEKEIYTITLNTGTKIRCAITHPLLSVNGCKNIGELNVGDYIAETNKITQMASKKNIVSNEEAFFIGCLLGDGNLTEGLNISCKNKDLKEYLEKMVPIIFTECKLSNHGKKSKGLYSISANHDKDKRKENVEKFYNDLLNNNINIKKYLGQNTNRFIRGEAAIGIKNINMIEEDYDIDLWKYKCIFHGSGAANEWLRKYNLFGHNSYTKYIDDTLLNMPDEQLRRFISGLWMTDGFISAFTYRQDKKRKTLRNEISYNSVNYRLIEQIRYLLLRLGIKSTIRAKNSKYKGRPHRSYNLIIISTSYIDFYNKIDLIGFKQARLEKMMSINTYKNPNLDNIPFDIWSNMDMNRYSVHGSSINAWLTNKRGMSREKFIDFGGNSKVAAADIMWSQIKSIEKENGTYNTYDLTIDTDSHIYLANNIYVHNSSINESICWALFNETRQAKVDDVIRWSANEVSVDFEFNFCHNTYRILRRRSRIAKESNVAFFIKENNKWINDSASTSSETDKKISSILKIDANIFLNSVYFKQEDISLFATSSSSDRKEIIKAIMKLEKWDEYQKQAKDKLKIIKNNIDIQQRIIADNDNLSNIQMANERLLEENDIKLNSIVKEHHKIQNKLHELKDRKKDFNEYNIQKQLDEINNKIKELKINGKKIQNRQAEIDTTLYETNARKSSIELDIKTYSNQLNDIKNKIIELQSKNLVYAELEDGIFSKRAEKNKLETFIIDLSNKLSIENDECKECFTQITNETLPHIFSMRDSRKAQYKKDLLCVNKELTILEEEYRARKFMKEQLDTYITKHKMIQLELMKLNSQEVSHNSIILTLNDESIINSATISTIIEKLTSLKIDLDALNNKIADSKAYNIDAKINELSICNNILIQDIANTNMELGSLSKEKEFLSQKIAAIENAVLKLEKYNKQKTIYEQLTRFFGKDGIQAVFIESIVDELEQCANDTLSYICNEPTVIKLKTQKKSGDSWKETLDIDVIMNGFTQTFESLSGGERFRISLALRIGLSEVLVKRAGGEIKLLLLDEVDQQLDAYGVNNLFESIIRGLEKRFKIMLISHNDKIKDRFHSKINVSKTANGSYISQK